MHYCLKGLFVYNEKSGFSFVRKMRKKKTVKKILALPRAEKRCKVLMMMKAAKLGWAGPRKG